MICLLLVTNPFIIEFHASWFVNIFCDKLLGDTVIICDKLTLNAPIATKSSAEMFKKCLW